MPVAAFELIDVLADQIAFDSVAGDKGQAFLKDFEFPEGRKFVDHGQEALRTWHPETFIR